MSEFSKYVWISGAFVAAVFVGIMAVQRERLLFRFGVGLLFLQAGSTGTIFGLCRWWRFALHVVGLTGAIAMFGGNIPFLNFGSPLAITITPLVVAVAFGAILALTAIITGLVLGAIRRRSSSGNGF